MDEKKKNIIILICLCIILILLGIIVYILIFSKSNYDSLLINDKENLKEENVVSDNEGNIKEEDNISNNNENADNDKNEDKINYNDKEDSKSNNDNTLNNNNNKVEDNNEHNEDANDKYDEDDVVSYFEDMEEEVDNSSSFKEKFKKYFIDVVDFIFYDKEVKGYTFDELGNMAKIKIISIALKIDSKIEEYVPNYKESISTTSSKIYNNVKEKLVTMYLDISTDICSGDNKNQCEKAKEIFGEVKNVCKIGWSFIKSLVNNGVTKLREWYEIYSGK